MGRGASYKRRRVDKPVPFAVRNHLAVPQPHPVGAPYRSNRGKLRRAAVLDVYRYGVRDGSSAEICEDPIHRQTAGEHVVKDGDLGIGRDLLQSADAEDVAGVSTHGRTTTVAPTATLVYKRAAWASASRTHPCDTPRTPSGVASGIPSRRGTE